MAQPPVERVGLNLPDHHVPALLGALELEQEDGVGTAVAKEPHHGALLHLNGKRVGVTAVNDARDQAGRTSSTVGVFPGCLPGLDENGVFAHWTFLRIRFDLGGELDSLAVLHLEGGRPRVGSSPIYTKREVTDELSWIRRIASPSSGATVSGTSLSQLLSFSSSGVVLVTNT